MLGMGGAGYAAADARDADDIAARHPCGKGDAKVVVVMPAHNAAQTLERTVDGDP